MIYLKKKMGRSNWIQLLKLQNSVVILFFKKKTNPITQYFTSPPQPPTILLLRVFRETSFCFLRLDRFTVDRFAVDRFVDRFTVARFFPLFLNPPLTLIAWRPANICYTLYNYFIQRPNLVNNSVNVSSRLISSKLINESVGTSKGSETPVKFLMLPARAPA